MCIRDRFTIVPFIVLAAVYFNRKMKEQFRIQRVQLGEINAQVEDCLLYTSSTARRRSPWWWSG